MMESSEPVLPTQWRRVALGALAIAVVALGMATWALVRSAGEPTSTTGSAAHSAGTKEHVCGAFDIVRKAVSVRTNANVGSDPVAREAVAANARLATFGGGDYLLSRLDPATPPKLADAVHSFANNLQEIGMNQLAGVPDTDPAVAVLLRDAQAASDQIAVMCK